MFALMLFVRNNNIFLRFISAELNYYSNFENVIDKAANNDSILDDVG